MRKAFVSHPYTDNPDQNKRRADIICRRLLRDGILPISPLHLFGFVSNERGIREDIMTVCYRLIDMCDEVRVYGDSPGTQAEVRYAYQTGKPVVDCTIEDWDRFMRERSEINIGR